MEHGNSQGQQKGGKDSKSSKYDDPKKGIDKLTKDYQQQQKKNTDRKKVFNSEKGSRNRNNRNILDGRKPPRQLWERPKLPDVTLWDKYKKDDDYHDNDYHDRYEDYNDDDYKKEFFDLEDFSYFPIYCYVDDGTFCFVSGHQRLYLFCFDCSKFWPSAVVVFTSRLTIFLQT